MFKSYLFVLSIVSLRSTLIKGVRISAGLFGTGLNYASNLELLPIHIDLVIADSLSDSGKRRGQTIVKAAAAYHF
jgi:hypothetical protein